jgi:GcrA cell cycle regulator
MAHDAGDAGDAQDRQAKGAARLTLKLTRFTWSQESVALLRRRWAEGASASGIAQELGAGVSRCAVLGKVHRLKLKQPEFKRHHRDKERVRKRPRGQRLRAPRPQSRRAGIRAPSRLLAAFQALGLDALFGAADAPPVAASGAGRAFGPGGRAFGPGCGLLELTDATCRWPVGDPGEADFAFCGAAPFKPYPYCVGHCLIAYRPDSGEAGESAPQRAATPSRRDGGCERAA